MFLICYDNLNIGCMGFRLVDDTIDIYNVILGDKKYGGQGLISQAMEVMINFIISHYPQNITAKIIIDNPALRWYQKNGFIVIELNSDFHLVQLDTCKRY